MSGIIDPNHKPRPWREFGARTKSALAVLLSLAILVGGGWFVWDKTSGLIGELQLAPDFEGPGKVEVVVTVPRGAGVTEIGDLLVEENVVRSTAAFLNAVKDHPEAVNIQAGTYRMKTELPASEALEILLDPEAMLRNFVLIPEGLRVSQQFQLISERTEIPVADLEAAAKDKAALGLPDYAPNVEGFLFPNTYEIPEETTAADLLKQMVGQYNDVAAATSLEARADSLGVSPLELLTIASIVEREVNRAEDRPKVARVIFNRLSRDMPLQMDSTVHYAVNDYENTTTTDEQRANKSPYNTYVHKGLPPGPISAPGRSSIEAATSPEAGDWLFFVTVNLDTGETRFADTLEEHNANVALFQQWCQANPGKGC
ncbi:endolytic transglycosylase MltG [Propionibacteriaceae bacterium Y2011]